MEAYPFFSLFWKSSGVDLSRLSPSAAKGAIELNDAEQFVAPRLGETQFRVKKLLLVVEHFEVAGNAAFITHIGNGRRVAIRLRPLFLSPSKFTCALVRDQAVRHFAECALYRLLVKRHRFLKSGFSQFQVAAQTTAREERHRDCGPKLPRARGTG